MFEKFQFKKFNPSEDLIRYSNSMLSQVMDIAPSDATCTATMMRIGNIYKCYIKVASSVGSFKAKARGHDPKLALDTLEERISASIRRWKKYRHYISSTDDWLSPGSYGGGMQYA